MEYVAIQVLLTACIEIVYLRAVIRIMRLRSNRIYLAVMFADFLISIALKILDILPVLNSMLGLISFFVVPVLLSVGNLRTRIVQATLLYLLLALTDLLGGVIYASLGSSTVVLDHVGPDNISLVITTYLVITCINILTFGAIIVLAERANDDGQPYLESPATVLLPAGVALYHAYITRAIDIGDPDVPLMSILPLLACCWISLLTIYLVLWAARREAEAQREMAEHTIAARRVRHTRHEVEGMAWRAEGMSSLRHELANQLRDIAKFAEAGEAAEAGRRLAKLSEQAQVISGRSQQETK